MAIGWPAAAVANIAWKIKRQRGNGDGSAAAQPRVMGAPRALGSIFAERWLTAVGRPELPDRPWVIIAHNPSRAAIISIKRIDWPLLPPVLSLRCSLIRAFARSAAAQRVNPRAAAARHLPLLHFTRSVLGVADPRRTGSPGQTSARKSPTRKALNQTQTGNAGAGPIKGATDATPRATVRPSPQHRTEPLPSPQCRTSLAPLAHGPRASSKQTPPLLRSHHRRRHAAAQ